MKLQRSVLLRLCQSLSVAIALGLPLSVTATPFLDLCGLACVVDDLQFPPAETGFFQAHSRLERIPHKGTGLHVNDPNTWQGMDVRGAMTASYVPPYDLIVWTTDLGGNIVSAPKNTGPASIAAAASLLGYSHFNWLQIIMHSDYLPKLPDGSAPKVPFEDPPSGGYSYIWGDHLPFYFNEADPDPAKPLPTNWDPTKNPPIRLSEHLFDIVKNYSDDWGPTADWLAFEDHPFGPYGAGQYTEFVTVLVGVKWPECGTCMPKWEHIDLWTWKTNYNPDKGTGEVYMSTAVDLTLESPNATGGIFDVVTHVPIENFSGDFKEYLVALGGVNIPVAQVPEPSSFYLTLMGLVPFLLPMARKYKRS